MRAKKLRLWCTGARVNELLNFKPSDIELRNNLKLVEDQASRVQELATILDQTLYF